MENPYEPPISSTETTTEETQPRAETNGLFLQLGVAAFFLSIASVGVWMLARIEDDLYSSSPGRPKDYSVLICFLYGLVFASIVNLFMPRGRIKVLRDIEFWKANLRNLHLTAIVWAVICGVGCWAIDARVFRIVGEQEWFQIAIVLFAASLQFFLWHGMANGKRGFPLR